MGTGGEIRVNIQPKSATLRAGEVQRFVGYVSGATRPGVTWTVNGIPGGDAAVGVIDGTGLYTAPATLPSPSSFLITATSVASPGDTASANVTLLNPVPVVAYLDPPTLIPSMPF